MRVYTVKKTTTSGIEVETEEILHNIVFSSEADAAKALKEDFDTSVGPLSEPIVYDVSYMELKTGGQVIKWEVASHEFNDGKLN